MRRFTRASSASAVICRVSICTVNALGAVAVLKAAKMLVNPFSSPCCVSPTFVRVAEIRELTRHEYRWSELAIGTRTLPRASSSRMLCN